MRSIRHGPGRGMGRYWPVFLLPMAAAFAVGFVWPFLQGLWLSLCRFTTTSNATFVGMENYLTALGDEGFV